MGVREVNYIAGLSAAVCWLFFTPVALAQEGREAPPPPPPAPVVEAEVEAVTAPQLKVSPRIVPRPDTRQGDVVIVAPPVELPAAQVVIVEEQAVIEAADAPPVIVTDQITVIDVDDIEVIEIDTDRQLTQLPVRPRSGLTQADADAVVEACDQTYTDEQARIQTEFATPSFETAEARAAKRKASLLENPDNDALIEGLQGPVKRRLIAEAFRNKRDAEMRSVISRYNQCMAAVRVPENEDGTCPPGSYLTDEPDENGAPICLLYQASAAPVVVNRPRLNNPAEVLRVAFNGGSPTMRHAIMKIAKDWENKTRVPGQVSGGLRFDFGTELPWGFVFHEWSEDDRDYSAEIRISFEPKLGYWSLIGNDSYEPLVVYPNEASMNLGGMSGYTPLPKNWRRTVYHEFGHAIGLEHEHQHPNSDCGSAIMLEDEPGYELTLANGKPVADAQGRRPSAVTLLGHTPNFWEPEEAILNLQQLQQSDNYITSDFDAASIMRYEFPAEWYASDAPPECLPSGESVNFPSPVDIEYVRRVYAHTVMVSADGNGGTAMASPEN